ncbi:MAG: hypothetical protein R3B13_07040 [Polyangiaceae bacterium]
MQAQVKGNSFRTLLAAVEALRSPEARQRVESALPESTRHMLRGIVPGGWYPMHVYGEIHGLIAKQCGTGEAFARALGRHTSQQDLKGFARFFFKFATPKQAMSATALIAPKYFRGASVEIVHLSQRSVRFVCSGFSGSTALMWAEFAGGIEPFIEAAGGKAIRVHRVDGGGDSPDADFVLHWL